MKKNLPVRLLVMIGGLTMAAIVAVQVYWVSQAVNRQEEQFALSVQMALRNVVESLCLINGNDISSNNPIDQLSSNYFIARTNYHIDLASLDYLLKAEFEKKNISRDYEFGVYDCQTNQMVYGDFVSVKSGPSTKAIPSGNLPVLVNDEYYFGVFFPGITGDIFNSLGVWKITTGLTILILIFFTYALVVILKQRRLSEVQRDFINNMTHEFKTPLTTLKVSSNVLIQEATSDRQRRYAEIITTESERLEKHVHQLLETSLLDHKSSKKKETINPKGVIESLLDRFDQRTFTVNLDLDQTLELVGDPLLFENILFNLIDNSFKYGASQIWVRIQRTEKQFTISITNDGPTIGEKEGKQLFNKFYRVPSGDQHDVKGFGLGLYFVKEAMKSFHGKVSMTSKNHLTTFTLQFPLP